MTDRQEPDEQPEICECPRCHACRVALELLEMAVFNCLAVGLEPDEVAIAIAATLEGLEDVDDDGELTASTTTAGECKRQANDRALRGMDV